MAVCTKYMVIQIFELHWKMLTARIKLRVTALNGIEKVAQEVDVVSS